MGIAYKSTNSLVSYISNHLIIKVSLPFHRALTSYSTTSTCGINSSSRCRENVKTPHQSRNQFLKFVRDECKSRSLKNVDHALDLFDRMLHLHPLPSIDDINHMFGAIARIKHYIVVVTLIK